MFSIIAAVGKNRELGKNGQLVFSIKEDMQFFRKTTTGHTVIMGYNTWKSLPGKLKNRENYVVSHDLVPEADKTITDLDTFTKKHEHTNEEIFVIGGGMIYKAFLPYARHLYLTEINASTDADTFFPEFDKKKYTKEILKKGSENDLTYAFAKYTLK